MKLKFVLPSNRIYAGFFTLTDNDGVLLMAGRALGKADNGRAAVEGNPLRYSTLPYGDTPTGEYQPSAVIIFDKPHRRVGRGWVPLKGRTGDALTAIKERRGLGIHAGRLDTDGRLVPTYGCVRISDRDFDQLTATTAGAIMDIEVTEED